MYTLVQDLWILERQQIESSKYDFKIKKKDEKQLVTILKGM